MGSPEKKNTRNLKFPELSKIKATPPPYLKEILKENGFLDDLSQTKVLMLFSKYLKLIGYD